MGTKDTARESREGGGSRRSGASTDTRVVPPGDNCPRGAAPTGEHQPLNGPCSLLTGRRYTRAGRTPRVSAGKTAGPVERWEYRNKRGVPPGDSCPRGRPPARREPLNGPKVRR